MEAVRTFGLTKRYGNTVAVDNLDMTVIKGEIFALLGVNGAGKTTTLRILSCLTQPTSGEAFVGGRSIACDELAVKSIIGVSPQQTAVAPNLTVRENLLLMCGIHKFGKEEIEDKIKELSDMFSLSDILDNRRVYPCFFENFSCGSLFEILSCLYSSLG